MSNETEKICTGCGRSSLNPIKEQYAACCPDNNYVIMNNEPKQTAVEWLQIQFKKGIDFNPLDKLGYTKAVDNLFKQAKEMEKEQRSIELPSDEEIEKANPFVFGSKHLGTRDMDIWTIGAQWMRDKIQGGNK